MTSDLSDASRSFLRILASYCPSGSDFYFPGVRIDALVLTSAGIVLLKVNVIGLITVLRLQLLGDRQEACRKLKSEVIYLSST